MNRNSVASDASLRWRWTPIPAKKHTAAPIARPLQVTQAVGNIGVAPKLAFPYTGRDKSSNVGEFAFVFAFYLETDEYFLR